MSAITKSSILTLAIVVALVVWLVAIGLFLELGTHDPYSWASPGIESDVSRSLFLARRDLYIRIGVISFVSACVLSGLKLFFWRHARSPIAS